MGKSLCIKRIREASHSYAHCCSSLFRQRIPLLLLLLLVSVLFLLFRALAIILILVLFFFIVLIVALFVVLVHGVVAFGIFFFSVFSIFVGRDVAVSLLFYRLVLPVCPFFFRTSKRGRRAYLSGRLSNGRNPFHFHPMALLHPTHPFRWPTLPSRPSPPPHSIFRHRSPSVSRSALAAGPPPFRRPYTSVMIVPTGVGAAIGGFAGDALPVARTLASVVDCLISHPNVLNAAMLYWPLSNALYVEGYALDRFAEGSWALQPIHQNKVGLVLDAGMEDELRIRHLQVADATRASLGLPIVEYIVTDTPLEVEIWIDPKCGKSTGRIKHPDSLLRAVETLVNRSQVNAVAVVGRFPDDEIEEMDNYRQGKGVDSLAGVEAIISHLVVKEFQIPCAHAPALSPLPLGSSVSPRSAAEEIGYTFLPCVLAGLSSAPQYVVRKPGSLEIGCILASNVDSILLPINACGGDGALAFARSLEKHKPLVIAIQENETVLDDTPDKLGIDAMKVVNYWEAIGVIAAHKAGVDPKSLRREGIGNIRGSSMPSFINHSASSHSPLHNPVYSCMTP